MKGTQQVAILLTGLWLVAVASAEVVEYAGPSDALDHDRFIHVPEGEKLMQGTLDALERSLTFIKSGRL